MMVFSTSRLARFFREVATPDGAPRELSPPLSESVQRFLQTAERYGYWNATPEENARVGLQLPLT